MESNVTSHRHDEKPNKWVLHLKPDENVSSVRFVDMSNKLFEISNVLCKRSYLI